MNGTTPAQGAAATLAALRSFLLVIFITGVVGAGTELALIEHVEEFWQLVPLVLLGASLVVLGWHAMHRAAASLRTFQALMLLFVASGFAGVFLHYRGNVEWERERNPTIGGAALVREALMGATPALAPGTMILLGLVGVAYTFRHPAGVRPSQSDTTA